jgi:hypothetical protein
LSHHLLWHCYHRQLFVLGRRFADAKLPPINHPKYDCAQPAGLLTMVVLGSRFANP